MDLQLVKFMLKFHINVEYIIYNVLVIDNFQENQYLIFSLSKIAQ